MLTYIAFTEEEALMTAMYALLTQGSTLLVTQCLQVRDNLLKEWGLSSEITDTQSSLQAD